MTQVINPTFANVWDAISDTPQEAANMKAKSTLLMAMQKWLAAFDGTQKEAATFLKVSQPRLSDLKRGHIDLFSLDMLLNMADLAGMSPTVQVKLSRMVRVTASTDLANARGRWPNLRTEMRREKDRV